MQISLVKGDITQMTTDAIVNAANSSLLGGGGVDGAIHRAGGPAILEECRKIRAKQGGCATGQAVITTGGLLSAAYVIHTVGPVWNQGDERERNLLHSCYVNSLMLAEEHGLSSMAFPNISTGIYRFPKAVAADIAIAAIRGQTLASVKHVIFVCFDEENYQLYQERL